MSSNTTRESQHNLIDGSEESISLMNEVEERIRVEDALADFDASEDPQFAERRLQLMRETSAILYRDAMRNGKKAQAHKKQQRAEYAAEILATQDRAVRGYQKATPERRAQQKKIAKANRSPEQIAREREADRERKKLKRDAERLAVEVQRKAIEENSEF